MMKTLLVIVVVILIVSGIISWIKSQPKPREIFDKIVSDERKFRFTHSQISSNGSGIAFNSENGKFLHVKKTYDSAIITEFNKEDIIDAEIIIDDKSQSINQIISGAILFGETGALLGAISGNMVKKIEIKLTLNNYDTPFVLINFLNHSILKNSNQLKIIMENVDKWMGIFKIILKENS